MNHHLSYQQWRNPCWTRIDLLLALYDETIAQLQKALETATEHGAEAARPLLQRFDLLLSGLVAGANPNGGELAVDFLRLYEFIAHCSQESSIVKLRAALNVLTMLREGLLGIREEAARLEREGAIPSADSQRLVLAVV